jgi:hypothetical protein
MTRIRIEVKKTLKITSSKLIATTLTFFTPTYKYQFTTKITTRRTRTATKTIATIITTSTTTKTTTKLITI